MQMQFSCIAGLFSYLGVNLASNGTSTETQENTILHRVYE